MCCRMNFMFKSQISIFLAIFFWGWLEAKIDLEDNQVPLLIKNRSSSVIKESALYWKIGAANDALKAGFSSLAARLYLELMNESDLNHEIRPETILNLVRKLLKMD